jgi:RHS repeat-associated protein
LALASAGLAGPPAAAAPAATPSAKATSVTALRVPVRARSKVDSDDAATRGLPPAAWPTSASADTDTNGATVNVGGLPVRVSGGAAEPSTRVRSAVPIRITVADQQRATAAGVHGVLLQVARTDGLKDPARVELSVHYAKFATGYGADYGMRLRLATMPDCALTTPWAQSCQQRTPLASTNDAAAQTVTAPTLSVGSAPTLVVLANSPTGTSSAGNWTATDLSPAYSWASGTSGGDFTLNYPIKTPTGLGGPEPDLSFAYSSGSVDAKTAAKTGQSSVVGEGWELAGGGFVERSFRTCAEDGGTGLDLCWLSDGAVTLVFGGRAVKLIKDGNTWRASDDEKLRIDNVFDSTSAHNNAVNGEYWRVTTQDGTQYHFGKLHRHVGDSADTASVQTEPVVGNNPGDSCYQATCQQAYRWNLDYVVDPRGNTMTYFYDKLVAKYGPAGIPYDLSATLKRVEYGTRAGSEAGATAPMRVLFTYAERCWNSCNWPTSGYADTPGDLWCTAATCPNIATPAHFTRYRLSAVTTQVHGGSAYRDVDKWELEQTFLTSGDSNNDGADDTAPNLWLTGLTRTGYAADGVTAQAEPQVTFGGTRLANRTDWGANLGMAPFMHWRITQVNNGVGGQTNVSYLPSDCTNQGPKQNSDSSPLRCFPMWYKGPSSDFGVGFFNKYVVGSVTEKDLTGGAPDVVTSYTYSTDGSSDTALWAHDDVDAANVTYTSWADWRGYPTVTTTKGSVAGQQTVTKAIYHRGLSGDAKWSGDDTRALFNARSAFVIEPLMAGSEMPVGLAGGGTNTSGGLCLDITNAQNFDGAPLQIVGCYGGQWQKWLRLTDGTQAYKNPQTGKCLDARSSGTANGTQVWLWTCNGGAAQRWLRQPDGSLRNPNSGRCLDINAYSIQPGATPQLWDCTGVWNQSWMITSANELILSQNSRCAVTAGTAEGSLIVNQPCGSADNSASATWRLMRNTSIVNPATGKCLDVHGGTNGSTVWLWTCNGGAAQQWVPQADGTLRNPSSGRCLDTTGNAVLNQGLTIWDCIGSLTQKWVGRVQDHSALAGQPRASYDLSNGATVGATIHRYNAPFTVSRAAFATPGATVYSFSQQEIQTRTGVWIAATGSWRWSGQDVAYDAYGLPTDVNDLGDTSSTADDACTHTDYARNTAGTAYLVDFPARTVTTDCSTTPADSGYLTGSEIYYDNSTTNGAPPSQGLPTLTNALASVSGGTKTWKLAGRAGYDPNGRVTSRWDPLDRQTTTAYSPPSGAVVQQVTVTKPLGQVTTTVFLPGRGVPTQVTDANLKVTTAQYDPLGRLIKVFKPHTSPATSVPDLEYTYTLRASGGPNALTIKRLGPNGNQITSYQLYDGLLRARQSQAPAAVANGGRIVNDTRYDERGLAAAETTFWNATAPTDTLVGFADTDVGVRRQHRYVYDALARRTSDGLYAANVLQSQTTAAYDGDRMSVTPPAGGIATTTLLDASGRVAARWQYTGGSPSGTHQDTTYAYDRLGRLTTTTDAAGLVWASTYDPRGRVVAMSDPDSGTTTYTFDDAGRVLTAKDAKAQVLAYKYDDLGRPVGVYNGSVTPANLQASWSYDTLATGQLDSSSRVVGGLTYTTAVTGYDDGYRPTGTSVTIPVGASLPAGTYSVTMSYKLDGSLATTGYPAVAGDLPAETVTDTYDNAGYLLTVAGAQTYVAATTYNPLGQVQERRLGTGTKQVRQTTVFSETTGLLQSNRTSTQNQTTTTNWDERLTEAYTYDAVGNVKSINETSGGTTVSNQCFTYDGFRQMIEAWTTTAATCQATPSSGTVGGPDQFWYSYTYNTMGSRATEVKRSSAGTFNRTYSYPGSGQRHTLRSVTITGSATGGDSYDYDDAGNLTSRTVTGSPAQTLTWDNEGHLATIADSGGTTSYVYDADGNRLVSKAPSLTTVHLPGFDLKLSGSTSTTTRYYRAGNDVVAVRTTAGLSWLSTDHHGTGQLVVDATTLVATRRRIDPNGNARGADPTWPTTRGFVGGTRDATGLIHLGAREYEPLTGRFISDDPVTDTKDPQQLNGYVYAAANPVSMSDPTGERTCSGPEDCAGVSGNGNPAANQQTAPAAKRKPTAPAKSKPGRITAAVKKVTKSTAKAILKVVHPPAKKAPEPADLKVSPQGDPNINQPRPRPRPDGPDRPDGSNDDGGGDIGEAQLGCATEYSDPMACYGPMTKTYLQKFLAEVQMLDRMMLQFGLKPVGPNCLSNLSACYASIQKNVGAAKQMRNATNEQLLRRIDQTWQMAESDYRNFNAIKDSGY